MFLTFLMASRDLDVAPLTYRRSTYTSCDCSASARSNCPRPFGSIGIVESAARVRQLHAPGREMEPTNLVRMRHAARLQHVQSAIPVTVRFYVLDQDPGIGHRRYAQCRVLELGARFGETRT